jgi:hypothetical protein
MELGLGTGLTMKPYTRIGAFIEGIFGALTVEFGDRLKRGERNQQRQEHIVYCLKILVRVL